MDRKDLRYICTNSEVAQEALYAEHSWSNVSNSSAEALFKNLWLASVDLSYFEALSLPQLR